METLAETWDDKLDSGIPEASIKEESLYTGEISDNTQTVISEDENGSNVDLSGSVTKEARACNAAGIDAFFSIVRGVTTLEEAMKKEVAAENMRESVEQVFRAVAAVTGSL